MTDHYDARETRAPADPRGGAVLAAAGRAAQGDGGAGLCRAPQRHRSRRHHQPRGAGGLPVLRKSELPALHKAAPPFGGFVAGPPGSFARLFTSPGPIFEPEPAHADPWRGARALFAAGFRPGDVVLNTFSYHLTPGGFIFDASARALGCAVIPAGPGNTEAAVRADRGVPSGRLQRHARLPEDPARCGRPPPAATSPRSSARWSRARRFRHRCRRRSRRAASRPTRHSAPPISA